MDGITILKTYEAVAYTTWGWSWFGFCLILLGLIASAIIIYYYGIKEIDLFGSVIMIVSVLFVCGIFSGLFFSSATKVYESRYDVYIHGEINMDEFNEKYKFIKQDGLIYTIAEKVSE